MTKRSTPSSTPKSPKNPSLSTTSWTKPRATDVLSYAYLWAREAAVGRDEGSKDRPVVVVLATTQRDNGLGVTVAPLTTRPPREGDVVVEVPAAVRAHLGLGDARCWIVATEINVFAWPGPDLRMVKTGHASSPYYGKIPGRLLEQVRDGLKATVAAGRLKVTKRGE